MGEKMGILPLIAEFTDIIIPSLRASAITESAVFQSRQDIRYLRLPESLIRYRIAGTGPKTIVFAVDPPVMLEQYDGLIQYLQNSFRVIVFEPPGFGFSFPKTGYHFDFTFTNNLIAKFLNRLGYAPYILAFPCGVAYGAIDIAARFTELVSGVILIQAPSWSEQIKWKHSRDKKSILSKPIVGQLAMHVLKRRRAPKWFDLAIGKRELVPEFIESTDRALSHGACFCLASAFQRYLTNKAPALSNVTQPSMVVWGEADKSHRHTDKSSSNVYCQGAEEHRFKDAGHFPELEEPALFAEKIIKWSGAVGA
jgi:pimeloyl-ACP methyl ester carboxylesterase